MIIANIRDCLPAGLGAMTIITIARSLATKLHYCSHAMDTLFLFVVDADFVVAVAVVVVAAVVVVVVGGVVVGGVCRC